MSTDLYTLKSKFHLDDMLPVQTVFMPCSVAAAYNCAHCPLERLFFAPLRTHFDIHWQLRVVRRHAFSLSCSVPAHNRSSSTLSTVCGLALLIVIENRNINDQTRRE